MKIIFSIIFACAFHCVYSQIEKAEPNPTYAYSERDTNIYQNGIDEKPNFPNLGSYLASKLHYSQTSESDIKTCIAHASFVVEKFGALTNIKIEKSSGFENLDKEAIRVLKSMPYWSPGMLDTKPVRVKFMIPITFHLN